MKSLYSKLLAALALVVLSTSAIFSQPLPQPSKSHYVTTYKEFDEAAKHALPGEEIVLANGNWTDLTLKVKSSGTADNMIYIRGEEPDKVFIDGATQIRLGGDYIYLYNLTFSGCVATSPKHKGAIVLFRTDSDNEANHCVISDCYFDSCVPDDKSFDDVWINLYGQYNTVQRCYMGGKDNKGLYIVVWHKNDKADFHTIRQNYFYRPKSHNHNENGQEIIRIGDSNNSLTESSCTIEGNFFYQCNGEIEILSIKSGDNTICGNTFAECQGAVTLRHGNYNTVCDNYFIANGVDEVGGVRVINRGHKVFNNYFYGHKSGGTRAPISLMQGVLNGALNTYNQVEDAQIYNNTLVDCASNFSFAVVGKNTSLDPVNVSVRDNIIVTNKCRKSQLIDDNGNDVSGIKFSGTHMQAADGVAKGDGYTKRKVKRSTALVAGFTVPTLETEISAMPRVEIIAAPNTCGPQWGGWSHPLM